MNKQFFEKVLPTQGNYCVVSISTDGIVQPRFSESLDDALETLELFNSRSLNAYFALGTFSGLRRKAEDCLYMRSFFLDIDCGEDKPYATQDDALEALRTWRETTGFPDPILVDSGNGVHVYWPFTEEVTVEEWEPYSARLKELCLEGGLYIDPKVTADAARILRAPDSFNYKSDPPKSAALATDLVSYDFKDLILLIGETEQEESTAAMSVLMEAGKGLDEDTRRIWEQQQQNFENNFEKIAAISLDGSGCLQIKHILENAASLPEPLWYAGISVAARCTDGMEAIHKLSEDYPDYSYDETERKAKQSLDNATGGHSCAAFESENPGGCKGCLHRGKLGKIGPLALGRQLRIAIAVAEPEVEADEAEPVREEANPRAAPFFPDFLLPFARGVNGGIYFTPPARHLKDGKSIQDDPELITPNDLYPINRLFSPTDGACLIMRLVLPKDAVQEFLLPMRDVVSLEKLKGVLAGNGVVFEPQRAPRLASYIMKWNSYMINTERADIMRTQQGWTDGAVSFVLGVTEYEKNGTRHCPPSPLSTNIVKHLNTAGSFSIWQDCINSLNAPGYELHAFIFLCGLASPLMEFTNVNGITVSAMGAGGCGKTGALYSAMSIWGKPDELVIDSGTENGKVQRMVNLKNLPFGMDEQSNTSPKDVSELLYKVSAGRSKLRMMASTNSERTQEYITNLICIVTTNQSFRDKAFMFKADATAEEMRLLEIEVKKPMHKGHELTDAHGMKIFDTLKQNYGHAGPLFIARILDLGALYVTKMVAEEREIVVEAFTKSSEYRFLNSLISIVFSAGRIGNDLGLFNLDLDQIRKAVMIELNLIIQGRKSTKEQKDEILGEFVNGHIQNILAMGSENKITMEPRGPLYIRTETDTKRMFVSSSALKVYLNERQLSVRVFDEEMTARGILIRKIKKKMGAGWKGGIGAHNVQAYEFKMDGLEGLFDEAQESAQAIPA